MRKSNYSKYGEETDFYMYTHMYCAQKGTFISVFKMDL